MKLTPLKPNHAKRVQNEIKETQKLIDKELSYSIDLQNMETIENYKNHIKHLENMLENGWKAPSFY